MSNRRRKADPLKDGALRAGLQGLGTLTVRLNPSILGALRLAAVKQRIAGEEPRSQQAIVEEALRGWLGSRGYL